MRTGWRKAGEGQDGQDVAEPNELGAQDREEAPGTCEDTLWCRPGVTDPFQEGAEHWQTMAHGVRRGMEFREREARRMGRRTGKG